MKKFKLLDPKIHGFVDYLVVALFLLAPTVLRFEGLTAQLCYALAGVHLLVTLTTRMPLGVAKFLPMKIHGYIELAVAPTLAALPWIFGFNTDQTALMFFSAFGATVFAAWFLTDYREEGDRREDRSNVTNAQDRFRKAG